MDDVVELQDVRVARKGFTLEVADWRLQPGRIVGVVGPNGAGKSTLLSLLPGLLRPHAGRVSVLGLDPIADPVGVRQQLGYMTDDLGLYPMRVDRLLWTLSRYWPTWDAGRVDALLERFDIDPQAMTTALNRGHAVRLRVLLALAFRPRVVVLDEPASGLDLGARRSLLETVLDVVQDPDCSVIVSSHILTDVERIADELLVINQGRIVQQGATDTLVGEERTLEEALIAWGAAG